MSLVDFLQIWLEAFFTLALFSFLYKDNPFYKITEHIFAGVLGVRTVRDPGQ